MSSERKYTTIPVLVKVKQDLDKIRGGKEWSKFLVELVEENRKLRRRLAARSLQKRFNTVESYISDSYRTLRKNLKLKSSEKEAL
ncbi:MAG: hypothetical protein KIH08_14790 [Candidatus Freyarchaeota archaeon]|nr:hypothetical protein [Candidatus Jordarchaeia archaeon]MBS7270522.1 hypothetical protein [Candidatus Jordarchaeia archaeon]MBS7281455.1 hypothetical protein [Candidatus Jordarchaeia archaeon]